MGVAEPQRKDPFTTIVAVSPLGTRLATSSSDGTLEVRAVESDQLAWASHVSGESPQNMVMSPDDKFLVLYTILDAEVSIFNLQSNQLHAVLKSDAEHGVIHISFHSDSRQIVCIQDRNEVELWDLDSCIRVWKIDLHSDIGFGGRVAISPQHDLLVWSDFSISGLVDAMSGESVVIWYPDERSTGLAWSEDGTQLLTGGSDGRVRVCDVASVRSTKQVHLLYECDTKHPVTFISFFDGHRCILTDLGLFPIPPQHRPACAADNRMPLSPETFFRLRDDGWVWFVGSGIGERRVCWLPPAYRPVLPTFNKNIVISRYKIMLVTGSGRSMSLDLKRWLENTGTGS